MSTQILKESNENVSRIQFEEKFAFGTLWFSGSFIVAVLIFIIGYIFYYGLPGILSFHYLFSVPEGGRYDRGGILY